MFREPARSQARLAIYLIAVFVISGFTDPGSLGVAWLIAVLVLRHGALASLKRVSLAVLPFTAAVSLAAWWWARLAHAQPTEWLRILSMTLRATLIAFLTLGALRRINLCRALAFSATLSRLLAITLAQLHALRWLGREAVLGLRSRMLRKPRVGEVLRGAATITGTLMVLSARSSRDVTDALRSRGV